MSAFLLMVVAELTKNQFATARRSLAAVLTKHGVILRAIKRQKSLVLAILRAAQGQAGVPVVVIDEETPNPAEAAWLRELKTRSDAATGVSPPQILYVTKPLNAQGTTQAKLHPLIRGYFQRDERGQWVYDVADRIIELLKSAGQTRIVSVVPVQAEIPGVVGTSRCFREAVGRLVDIFDASCGLVAGEVGVGKMFLIRSLHRHRFGKARMTVLPCGVFFKDYYMGGSHRVLGGGRDAIEQLRPYLAEAENGVLILHHVERLPTAVQDQLATVLQESAANRADPTVLSRIDLGGLHEVAVRIIATSTMPPELLAQTGRMLPELVRRLTKHHVKIPSLRERGFEDIRLLTDEILPQAAARAQRATPVLDEDALLALQRAEWPNNISDLVRALEHAVLTCRPGGITRGDLPPWLGTPRRMKGTLTLDEIVKYAERTAILNTLDYTGGDIREAARMLGRDPKGLYRLMNKLGLKTKRLRSDFLRR
jgi:DNA-binding NtrC family response regulator